MTGALVRFHALSRAEQARTMEAALCLFAVRMAFGALPFSWALRLFGIVRGEGGAGRIAAPEACDVSRAIVRAARHVPFRAVCLQQSFTALLMLRRRGLAATVHLGLAREDGAQTLKAHAWSYSGEVPVTGVPAARDFVQVAAFAA